MRENADQKNSEYGHFSRSDRQQAIGLLFKSIDLFLYESNIYRADMG